MHPNALLSGILTNPKRLSELSLRNLPGLQLLIHDGAGIPEILSDMYHLLVDSLNNYVHHSCQSFPLFGQLNLGKSHVQTSALQMCVFKTIFEHSIFCDFIAS